MANLELLASKKYSELTSEIKDYIKLENVVELYDYKRIPLSSRERETRKGMYPYYGATGILDYVSEYLFDGEYILLAEDGTVINDNGNPIVQLVNGTFWVNNHAHIMQANNGYNNYSLYIALKQLSVAKAVTGAVQLKINQANLLSLEIPKLNENALIEFNQICEVLFAKILHLREVNQKLQQLKQLYLKKFFD